MKTLLILLFAVKTWAEAVPLETILVTSGQVVPEMNPTYKESKLREADIVPLTNLLASGRIDQKQSCEIQAKDIRESRVFSSGAKWIETIEVKYRGAAFYNDEILAHFPIGSRLKKRMTVSASHGPVEEIVLVAKDSLEHQLLFQHDGRGHLVHLEMVNLNRVFPCKRRR